MEYLKKMQKSDVSEQKLAQKAFNFRHFLDVKAILKVLKDRDWCDVFPNG